MISGLNAKYSINVVNHKGSSPSKKLELENPTWNEAPLPVIAYSSKAEAFVAALQERRKLLTSLHKKKAERQLRPLFLGHVEPQHSLFLMGWINHPLQRLSFFKVGKGCFSHHQHRQDNQDH
jgi:hypothetical protein